MELPQIKRQFIANDQILDNFSDLEPYYISLRDAQIGDETTFRTWIKNRSELDAFIEENAAWRYIRMTIDTSKPELTESYTYFVSEIQPLLAPLEDELNRKMMASPFVEELEKNEAFHIYFKNIKVQLDLFREENIAIEAFLGEKAQEYGAISGAQSIEHEGQTITMQQAAVHLKNQNEEIRKAVYDKLVGRRRQDTDTLNDLFTTLVLKRHELATNAGFANYRDYKFSAMGRFDYTKEHCFDFHRSVEKVVVPMVKKIQLGKLQKLQKKLFKPWDLDLDPDGKAPLKPFKSGQEMFDKTQGLFEKMDPYFGACLSTMEKMKHLDLESKPGKSPGGYNYPLYEIGVPFIFMNAVGTHRDLITMVHEGGHAIHSFLNRDLELTAFKNIPSEAAELASMSMELLSMKYWSAFYSDPSDENRAKREHLEDILKVLPWIAQIDAFQHWIYTHPHHTHEERTAQWLDLSKRFGTGLTDWTGYEDQQQNSWHRQLHLFEVPFYYIEYGIAQLGALGVWLNSIENEKLAIDQYKKALSLGYTTSLPHIYEAAGIKFDFTEGQISKLMSFVGASLHADTD